MSERDPVEFFECSERPVPFPVLWNVICPSCGEHVSYEPADDDAGQVWELDPAEWPVCDCGCMFTPKSMVVREVKDERR